MYITNPEKVKDHNDFNIWLETLVHTLREWVASKDQLIGGTGQITITINPDGTVTFSLNEATGWPLSPGATISFDDGTRTFTVTDGGSAYYLINGTKYELGGNHTVQITDTEGLWFIYFLGDTLTASQTPWVITDNDKALVAYVHWDATNNKSILVGYEFHTYVMDASTHSRLHHCNGTAWDYGVGVSDTGANTINVSEGEIHDEDIEIEITDGSGGSLFEQVLSPAELPVYYLLSGAWRKIETTDKNNATDVGYVSGTDLQYNDVSGGGALANVSGAKYMAMWIYASNDIAEPIIAIMGQREDTTFALATDNNTPASLSFGGSFLAQEALLLARVIIQETASGLYYTIEDITDYRGIANTGGTGSIGANDHGALSGLNDVEDHPYYLLMDGSRTADFIHFDITYVPVGHTEGDLHWDADNNTLELDMAGGNVHQQIGQEILLPKRVFNNSGVDIKNGEAVYITGGSGSNSYIALADASDPTTAMLVGLATEDIDNNSYGWVTSYGLVRGDATQPVDTSSYSAGDFLFLSETAGQWTDTRPDAPALTVGIGVVFRSHASEGVIFVLSRTCSRLSYMSDVQARGTESDLDVLQWNASNSRWENGGIKVATHTPSSSSDTGTTGTIAWDSSYFYVCIATNTWKRVSITGSTVDTWANLAAATW